MAELALGLTKTVVEGALSRIQLAIEEEDKLKQGVQQDLEFITGEFQMMQSFLKVANRERAKKNEVVRAWVRQLRDLAFDVENWVEFVVHLEKNNSLSSCGWRLVPSWAVPRCLAPPRHLHEAAAEMKLLKARVHDVSQRNTRYNLFNSDDSSSGSGPGFDPKATTIANLSSTALQVLCQVWRDETDRFRDVDSLQNLITHEVVLGDDLEVIWLWGVDDRYASDHIHKAYHDPEICRSFKRRAWIKISHPFNLQVFLDSLVAQLLFVGSSHQHATHNGLTKTKKNKNNGLIRTAELIEQVTKEQRYLVVLENVSDLVEWNTIRMYLPENKKGSRVLVSTQNLRHAILCTEVPYLVSELGWFVEGHSSICAVYKKVQGRSDSAMDILIEKMKRGGVISVYDDSPMKSSIVKKSYLRLVENQGKLDGVTLFDEFRWVPVADDVPFSLVDFSRRLLLPLSDYGFYDGHDLKESFHIFGATKYEHLLYKAKEEELIGRSHKFLRNKKQKKRLVVIHGLRSTKDWDDLVKSTILPDGRTKCCVVVVTNDESVAKHCVHGKKDLLVRISNDQAPMALGPSYTSRREKSLDWMRRMSHPGLAKRRSFYVAEINYCMKEIDSLTESSSPPPVVSVWGIAGVGKSALVRWWHTKKLFVPKKKNMFMYYCWVDVPHPFSLAELSLRLYLEFLSEDHQRKEDAMIGILEDDGDPVQECRLFLRKHTPWLLVLDGLRSVDEWDTINDAFCLSQPTLGSKTIVITNEQSVAKHCVEKNDEQVVNVQGLKADEALHLFHKTIDMNKNADMEPEDLDKELSASIMAKCGGLPKVIDAVADYYKVSSLRPHLKLKDINHNFMQILDRSESLRDLFSWMQSYLETCKDDLKPCIFYLPVFPIGHSIRVMRLLRRLIAEGYIRETSSNTAEENGDSLLSELWEFSMFQFQESSNPGRCQVNGFLHEYINSRPMEDNLVSALEGPYGQQLKCVGQHLSIRKKWNRDMNDFQSIDFSRLRSLTVFGDCRPFMFDPDKIKMRYVRVLDLEDASGVTNDDLKHIMEAFPRLKFLSLRGCGEITYLPMSLGVLIQLQTLDVRDTSIATLPKAILKLQRLQYVRAGTIHTAPWDKGGIMVPYQAETREEIISTSVPAQDRATTTPSVLEENLTIVATYARRPAQGATTVPASPAPPAEGTAILVADPTATAEDATIVAPAGYITTFAADPRASAEANTIVAAAPSTAASEDTTTFATAPLSPSKVATTVAAVPSAPEEGTTTSTAASSTLAEDVTTITLAPSAAAEDAKNVAACPLAPVENTIKISRAQSGYSPMAAAAPSKSTSSSISAAAQSALVPSWLSKLCCRSQSRLDNTNHGVEVPVGIGNLTTLHTLGIVNVGPGNNSVILKELYKLTRLRRLGVCGINPDNIHEFFSAIASLNYLQLLSVRLDKNMNGVFPSLDDTIAPPPKTLSGCLKLHGHVRILPSCSWIKEFVNVGRLDLEITLQEQHDIQVILDHLIHRKNGPIERLCMKPVQGGELHIGINNERKLARLRIEVLEIVCTTNLQVSIGNLGAVGVLRVDCSSGPSLQLSGLPVIRSLREVWLKGSCSDILKEGLQRQLDQRQDKHKAVLKVLQPYSS